MDIANVGRTLQVAFLAFIGLLFYLAVISLLSLAGRLLIEEYAHASVQKTTETVTCTSSGA